MLSGLDWAERTDCAFCKSWASSLHARKGVNDGGVSRSITTEASEGSHRDPHTSLGCHFVEFEIGLGGESLKH